MITKPKYSNCTFVILTGGKSTRMGTDKGFLKFSGNTFIEKIINLIQPFSKNILLSVGNHNQKDYERFGLLIVVDEQANMGPISGIVSTLHHVSTDWFFVISVDAPFITDELILQLWNNREGYEAILFSENNIKHPLVALYHISSKGKWESALHANNLKVMKVTDNLKCNVLPFGLEKAGQLTNINTRDEYKSLINNN